MQKVERQNAVLQMQDCGKDKHPSQHFFLQNAVLQMQNCCKQEHPSQQSLFCHCFATQTDKRQKVE